MVHRLVWFILMVSCGFAVGKSHNATVALTQKVYVQRYHHMVFLHVNPGDVIENNVLDLCKKYDLAPSVYSFVLRQFLWYHSFVVANLPYEPSLKATPRVPLYGVVLYDNETAALKPLAHGFLTQTEVDHLCPMKPSSNRRTCLQRVYESGDAFEKQLRAMSRGEGLPVVLAYDIILDDGNTHTMRIYEGFSISFSVRMFMRNTKLDQFDAGLFEALFIDAARRVTTQLVDDVFQGKNLRRGPIGVRESVVHLGIAPPLPVHHIVSVIVNDVPHAMVVFAGDTVDVAVDRFLKRLGLDGLPNAAEYRSDLAMLVGEADATMSTGSEANPAPTTSAPHPLGDVVVQLRVTVEERETVFHLYVREKHTVLAAVEQFLTDTDLPRSAVPLLVQAVEAKLREAGVSMRLFSAPVQVDHRPFSIDYFDGEDVDEVVFDILDAAGLRTHVNFEEYVEVGRTIMYEYLYRAGKVDSNVPPPRHASSIYEESFDHVVVSIHLAGASYEVEFPVTASLPAVAKEFCYSEWLELAPLLAIESEHRIVAVEDCGPFVAEMLANN